MTDNCPGIHRCLTLRVVKKTFGRVTPMAGVRRSARVVGATKPAPTCGASR
jgi:hypothetical protein